MKKLFLSVFAAGAALFSIAAFAASGTKTEARIFYVNESNGTLSTAPDGNTVNTTENPDITTTPAVSEEIDPAMSVTAVDSAQTAGSARLVPEDVNVPDDAAVLYVLSGRTSETKGTFRAYTRADSGNAWKEVLSTQACYGRKGLGKTIEGDERTPIGVMKVDTPFGLKPALSGFPDDYIQVTSGYYWVGDSDSPLYNTLLDTNVSDAVFSKSKSENLINYGGYYNYCLNTGYNPERTPHAGSAIFIHCVVDDQRTGGCIALPEADMIEVMRLYESGRTYIAVHDVDNPEAVCK